MSIEVLGEFSTAEAERSFRIRFDHNALLSLDFCLMCSSFPDRPATVLAERQLSILRITEREYLLLDVLWDHGTFESEVITPEVVSFRFEVVLVIDDFALMPAYDPGE